MSFQDFSSSGRNRNATSAGRSRSPMIPPAPSSGGSSAADRSSNAVILNQISEALLQYQRNVGILEKIVQSLASGTRQRRNTLTTDDELNLQYQAQVDVIGQLEDKVRRLLQQSTSSKSSSATTGPAVKLQRDFERVQSRAKALQGGVDRLRREQKALKEQYSRSSIAAAVGGGGGIGTNSSLSAAAAAAAAAEAATAGIGRGAELDHYEQVQLQLQQDRLAEEIMREREEEIRNINRGMHQVNEIYKDLATIVNSQQEQVDVIETQMEDANVNAQSGLNEVTKANEKYGSSNCIIS